ncbi:MAG: bacteriohemerythrin, partial [Coriobacteriia bacterium]|nr:bacteriohemerythrin [Coriobacteriia bacterium]
GEGRLVLGGIVDGLIEYTHVHFAAEERFFVAYDYPEAAAHKAQHDEFVTKVTDFRGGLDQGRLMLTLEVMDFLSEWLVGHIQGSDREYVPYLRGGSGHGLPTA